MLTSEGMKSMAGRYIEKIKHALNWGKIVFPLSSMRFYPPQFILRDPVLEGITAALNEGYEVAVIIFNVKDMNNSMGQIDYSQYPQLHKDIKKYFRINIEMEIKKHNIITLHDLNGDGLTLFIKTDDYSMGLYELDSTIKKIIYRAENHLFKGYPSIQFAIETGYMFIEKTYSTVQEAIRKAQRQANSMAEKQVKSERNEMIRRINMIVSKKKIQLLAQPIIDVATSEIRAWEMLTRGPKGTDLESPLSLFSVARQVGMLYSLEMVVIEKVLEQIKMSRCRQDIFVNCTPITLGNIRFIGDLKEIMQKYKSISPKQITIEVTENDSIDGMKNFIYNIKMLRLLGFRIAIDDTGAGYSNLSVISEIMPDVIKIDRSVIQNIDKNLVKESMLKGLLLVAREAGSIVVAEGIENAEEALVLTRNKVDLAQGFFYAQPAALTNTIAT